MSDPRTQRIRQTLNEVGDMIESLLSEKPAKPTLEQACPFCGAPVDRDIDGQYECGTAWGSRHDDRAADCLRAELEDLRSRPHPLKVAALMTMLNNGIEFASLRCASDEYYAGKWNALCDARNFVKRLFGDCEAANG